MVRRFTVIQGGLSEAPALVADLDLVQPEAWRIDVTPAWNRHAETGPEALRGVVPRAMPHPIRGGRAGFRQPDVAEAAGLFENAAAEAVDRAPRIRLGVLRRPVRASGSVISGLASPPVRPRPAAGRAVGSRPIPAGSLIGIRPAGWERPIAAMPPTAERAAVHDAVETSLSRDAPTARRPIGADPAEVYLVRVVSRLFARRGALVRRAGAIVAGTLHLGTGAHAATWRRARA